MRTQLVRIILLENFTREHFIEVEIFFQTSL